MTIQQIAHRHRHGPLRDRTRPRQPTHRSAVRGETSLATCAINSLVGDRRLVGVHLAGPGDLWRPVRTMVAKLAHQIPDRPLLQLAIGERVDVGDQDSEWPEFVFVTASHGNEGVPARQLSATSGTAVVQTAYDTTELPTHTGDVLEVVAEDLTSDWHWCRARDDPEGWVPIKTLQAAESSISDQRPQTTQRQVAKPVEMHALIRAREADTGDQPRRSHRRR